MEQKFILAKRMRAQLKMAVEKTQGWKMITIISITLVTKSPVYFSVIYTIILYRNKLNYYYIYIYMYIHIYIYIYATLKELN
jgi:hypothetical protein